MLPPAQERLFMALAEDHQPRMLQQLFDCVKHHASERVMYRRLRLLARDTENALRIDNSPWCIANSGSGFVMRARYATPERLLASNVKPTQKAKAKPKPYKPKRRPVVHRDGNGQPMRRIYLDPAKAVR